MASREDGARQLFQRGEYVQLLGEFSDSLNKPGTDAVIRVTVAHALAITGRLDEATRVANVILNERQPAAVHARAELVLGLAAERAGNVDVALAHYTRGVTLVDEGHDAVVLAWIRLHQFRLVAEGHSMSALTAMIPHLRRLTIALGEPQLMAYLHMCIAVFEGETGHFDEAHRHNEMADALLETSDSSALRSANLVNRGCLAILAGEFSEAATSFNLAKALTAHTGDPFIASRADGNLAHLHLFSGDLDAAQKLFEETLRKPTLGKLGEVGALDGLARVHLARGALDACNKCLEAIDSYGSKHESLPSMYHVRWAGLTRVRLLLRKEDYVGSSSLLERLRTENASVKDRPFEAAVALSSALARGRIGDVVRAALEITVAERAGALRMPELQPQLYFIAGRVCESRNKELSNTLHWRANRLWAVQGVVSTRVELEGLNVGLDVVRDEIRAARSSEPQTPKTIATITNAIASTLELSHHPRLRAAELLSIIRALDCSAGAEIAECKSVVPESDERRSVVILGRDASHTIALVCPIPLDPEKAILLADVLRIASAGSDLDNARRDERNRLALWPASPAEEQAGALFIAEEMQGLLSIVRRVASNPIPVLITGETGTGKEVLARTVHGYSDRAAKPFIPFNCSAVPRDMLDSQLFGHRKGAFTGATENFPGVIRAAAGGTLFLDEIGETPLELQPKLLRFLESSEVHPIGETQPIKVDVRVIAATNADIERMIAEGRFREDLYYRLNIIRLPVPPLRARREEIPVLAQHYLDKYSQEAGKHGLRLAEETVEYLVLYKWPGNIRQLANEMRRMTALADNGAVLMPEHLSPQIAASRRTVPPSERKLDPTEIVVRMDQPMPTATAHLERAMILHAMTKCGNRLEDTAAMLGISRKGLYLKRQRLGLEIGGDDVAV